jgi:hypothetical protein
MKNTTLSHMIQLTPKSNQAQILPSEKERKESGEKYHWRRT